MAYKWLSFIRIQLMIFAQQSSEISSREKEGYLWNHFYFCLVIQVYDPLIYKLNNSEGGVENERNVDDFSLHSFFVITKTTGTVFYRSSIDRHIFYHSYLVSSNNERTSSSKIPFRNQNILTDSTVNIFYKRSFFL